MVPSFVRSMRIAVLLPLLALVLVPIQVRAAPADYPTEDVADYIFACMASNGQTSEALRRCSCSIDYIASQLTYDEYREAETVLRMQQVPSGDDRMVMFRTATWAKDMVEKLRRAQIEADFECF